MPRTIPPSGVPAPSERQIILVNRGAKDIGFEHDGREFVFYGINKANRNQPTHTHIPEDIGRFAQAEHDELEEIRLNKKTGKFVKV